VKERTQHFHIRTNIHNNKYSNLIFIKLFVSLKALSLNSPSFVEYLNAAKKKHNLEKYYLYGINNWEFNMSATYPLSRGCQKLDAYVSVHNTIHHSCLVKEGMCLHTWWTSWKYLQPKKDNFSIMILSYLWFACVQAEQR